MKFLNINVLNELTQLFKQEMNKDIIDLVRNKHTNCPVCGSKIIDIKCECCGTVLKININNIADGIVDFIKEDSSEDAWAIINI